jgi:hypothetical protein
MDNEMTARLMNEREKLLQRLGDNTRLLQRAKVPEFDNRRCALNNVVLTLTIAFTDGESNYTEWSDGHSRMLHERSVRKMYGNRITGVRYGIHIKGTLNLQALGRKKTEEYCHMH